MANIRSNSDHPSAPCHPGSGSGSNAEAILRILKVRTRLNWHSWAATTGSQAGIYERTRQMGVETTR